MGVQRHCTIAAAALCITGLAVSISGCGDGGSDSEAAAAFSTPAVDPRFATGEALLEYYNQVAMTGPKVNIESIFDLLYAETVLQEQLIEAYRASLPLIDLDDACWEAFGAGFRSDSTEPPRTPERNRASMTEIDSDRAKATHLENDGDQIEIYLVRVGDRWWVSGYTLEYDPDLDLANTDLEKMRRGVGLLAAAAPTVTAEIRSGRWNGAGPQGPDLARLFLLGVLQRDHGVQPGEVSDLLDWTKDE